MAETLMDYLANHPFQEFRSVPQYFETGDFLSYFIRDEQSYAKRIDEYLTVYHSITSEEIVGFKIKGVRHVIEKAGKFRLTCHDGEVSLTFILFSFSMRAKDCSVSKTYEELGVIANDVRLPKDEFDLITNS
jgi:hypothetical protein